MKDIKDIDQLISSKMEGFEALPPAESWLAIQDSLQQIASAPITEGAAQYNIGSKVTSIVKQASLATKIATLSIAGILGAVSIYFISSQKEQQTASTIKQSIEVPKEAVKVLEQATEAPQNVAATKQDENSRAKNTSFNKAQNTQQNQENSSPTSFNTSENKVGHESQENILNQPLNENNHSAPIAVEAPKPIEAAKQQDLKKPEGKKLEKEIVHSKPTIYDVITPNGDGSNDAWIVSFDEPLASYYLRIYNNKGEVVFETHSAQEHWHGLHLKSGELCEEGRYIFELQYKYPNSQEPYQERGFINLIR
ncbi:MAG: hypothetical protein FGM41_07395 [Bacteroidetes bacterium]|nr:hypothetical protein [Bacteroidota bacterium]